MRTRWVLLICVGMLLFAPTGAFGHAQLLGTSPQRGAQLEQAPAQIVFRFNEPVEISFGSVRVLDADGEEVQSGTAEHPGGRGDEVAVELPSDLDEGGYAATYRVISADSHPVSGGFVFTVGKGGPALRAGIAELIDERGAGPATEIAFGAVRALAYLAIALALGGLVFVFGVWRPGLLSVASAGKEWSSASEAFANRAERLLLAAALLGVATSALGIVSQGATAASMSLWEALDPQVIDEVLSTRFGAVWGLRLLAWVAIAILLAIPALGVRLPRLRAKTSDAARFAPLLSITALAALVGFVAVTPALAGHATTQDPLAVLLPADLAHVAGMAVWVGGLLVFVAAVPVATGRLLAPDRTRLLAELVARFSPLALASVAGLLVSGVLQTVVHLSSLSQLWESAFGRAVAIKVVLLLALVGLGAYNRQRSRPALQALAKTGEAPGGTGFTLRRALRAEVALLVAVLGVTAALVSYAPPATTTTGPYSASAELGPARLELTVDPAQVGTNEIHLYLFDARSGEQFDRPEEMSVELSLPEQGVGPLAADVEKAGPGHYVVRRAEILPGGEWEIAVRARVSEFEEYRAELEVLVR